MEKKIGFWTATSLVIGNMIGSGVFLMPAQMAAFGSIGLVGWIVSAVGAILLARLFGNLSRVTASSNGGPYAFTKEGLGNFAGFQVAWGYLISTWCTNAAIAVAFIGAMSTFFPQLAHDNLLAVISGLSAIWFLTWINTLGIIASGKTQLITTILKLIPLIFISVAGIFFLKLENFFPINSSGTSDFSAIAAAASLTFFAFTGLECATIPSASMENPQKNIPKATLVGTILTTFIYLLSSVSIMGLISQKDLVNSVTPFADAATIIFGSGSEYWIGAGVAIAAFGALNGWILIQGQVAQAISNDHLFPVIFARNNNKNVPAFGIVIGSIIVSIIMIMNYSSGLAAQFKFLILMSTITILVPYLFSAFSYLIILMKVFPTQKLGLSAIFLAFFSFLFSMWAIFGSGENIVYLGFMCILSGTPIYIWMQYRAYKANIVDSPSQ